MVVARMQPHFRVDDEQKKVRFADCLIDLSPNLDVHRQARIVSNAAGVDEPECLPRPVGLGEVAVASRPRFLGHNRGVVPDDAVEQLGFSDVRTTNQCNDGNAHAAASATRGSPSWTSTSMKS